MEAGCVPMHLSTLIRTSIWHRELLSMGAASKIETLHRVFSPPLKCRPSALRLCVLWACCGVRLLDLNFLLKADFRAGESAAGLEWF